MKTLRLALATLLMFPALAQGAAITYSGYLDDASSLSPAGGQLVDFLLGAPDLTTFPDQNVALFEFTVASASTFTITSRGYNDVLGNTPNVDGFDAYVAIFGGSGHAAVFLEEFFNPVAPGDFQATTGVLGAGVHTLAISMWNNFACGNGGCVASSGTLGDAFSGLSNPDLGRALYFEVDLESTGGAPVPEPSTMLLVGSGAVGMIAGRYRRRRELAT
jgi:hypothetical protein